MYQHLHQTEAPNKLKATSVIPEEEEVQPIEHLTVTEEPKIEEPSIKPEKKKEYMSTNSKQKFRKGNKELEQMIIELQRQLDESKNQQAKKKQSVSSDESAEEIVRLKKVENSDGQLRFTQVEVPV